MSPECDSGGTESDEERVRRAQTIRQLLEQGDWLTSEQLNARQAFPPADKRQPASDWKSSGRVFSVMYQDKELFARFQFDASYQPLPVIREILTLFGEVADAWALAAWFHYPSAWLVEGDEKGARNVPPKDVLDRRSDVLAAAAKHSGSYVA